MSRKRIGSLRYTKKKDGADVYGPNAKARRFVIGSSSGA